MREFLEDFVGFVFRKKDRDAIFDGTIGRMPPKEQMEFLRWQTGQITAKSGALLAAQSLFMIVDTFALGNESRQIHWNQPALMTSFIILLVAAPWLLFSMKGGIKSFRPHNADSRNRQLFDMILTRNFSFNMCLYATLASFGFTTYAAFWKPLSAFLV